MRVATSPQPPIAMHAMPILPGLSPVEAKSLTATFDAGRLSSDGGLVVLREIEARPGLAETITGPLRDDRAPARIRHSYAEMARARMLMIAAASPAQKKHERGWGRRGMKYPASEKLEIIRIVEQSHLPVRRTLKKLVSCRVVLPLVRQVPHRRR